MNLLTWTSFIRFISSPITWLLFISGMILGSFLNVCIFRIPDKTFWKSHRSLCRSCEKPIPAWLNIPIFSFIFLKGKTKCCGQKLSWQYPIVEFLTALAFVFLYAKYPFLTLYDGSTSIDTNQLIRYGHALLFTCLLIVCSFIDLRLRIIPDVISLPMIISSPLVVYFHPELTLKNSLLGIFAGAGIIYAVAWGYFLIRKEEGIGMGDAKLLAAIGGWLGVQAIFPTFFYGSLVGSAAGLIVMLFTRNFSMRLEIPFGPFLALGAIIHMAFGLQLLSWMAGA